jgi:hypothetical protein
VHTFTVTALAPGQVELRHTLTGRPTGAQRLRWPLVVQPLHDALLEDALDNAERELTGTVARPARWSLRVRLLRRVVRRGRGRGRDRGRARGVLRRGAHGPPRKPVLTVDPPSVLLPRATFYSSHHRWVDAPPEVVRRAAEDLTVDELRLARGLMSLRRLPAGVAALARPPATSARPAEPGGQAPTRFLDSFTSLGFVRLDDPGHDHDHGGNGNGGQRSDGNLSAGAVARFWQLRPSRAAGVVDAASFAAFDEPGWAKAATTLAVTAAPDGRGSIVATTTAVEPTDEAARRAFARYWRLISLPSGLIRRDWLAAIARRAEAQAIDRGQLRPV